MKAVIVALSVIVLLFSSAALARGDEVVRRNTETVQTAQAVAKLQAQEAALLKQLADVRQAMAKALEKAGK